jgi:photosystem II stability/assembly factor-like uncharacterized protein
LLPALEQTIDLGPTDFESLLSPRLLALDVQADRLYVSLTPSRTLVLDANALTPLGEIPFGGALSVDADGQRLYIGVPGRSTYSSDGASVITPAELKLFDTANLALLGSTILSDTSTLPPLVAIDPVNDKAYVTHNGITIMDATTLEVQGVLSGTRSLPDAVAPGYTAVDAAILPQQQRLFVSLNNGIPGSNNGNVVAVYDLATGQVITQDLELSVDGFAVDETTGAVYSPRSRPNLAATVKYDAQGRTLKRLTGSFGTSLIDPAHDRVYLYQWLDALLIKVLDRDLNLLGVASFPEIGVPQSALIDAERDRVLVLQHDGKLAVLKEQGQPLGLAAAAPVPARQDVKSLIPSPQINTDQKMFALFALDESAASQGSVFVSSDAGATWQGVTGLPGGVVNALAYADDVILAVAGGNGVDEGYGIWRSSDAGQTWLPSSRGLADLGVTRLAVSPDFARDGTLYALSQRGVFRSSDRGATWASLADRYAPLLKDLTVAFTSIAVSPNFAQDNSLLLGHTSGLWRSTDRGETWTKIESAPPATRLVYTPDGSIVFALNYDGVQRSNDGGLTWQAFNTGLDLSDSGVADLQVNDREAVVLMTGFGQPNTVYRLPLHETTWQLLPIEADVTALALTPDDQLYIGVQKGPVQRVQ